MFYRFVVDLMQPYTLVVLGLLVASILAWRTGPQNTRWRRLAAVLLGCLVFISMPAVAMVAAWSLERWYPPLEGFPADAEAIVVLTGGMRVYDEAGEKVELTSDSTFRAMHGAELYHRAGHKLIVASGGRVVPDFPGPTLARATGDLLLRLGVQSGDLLLEEKSRTTYENALYCREELAKRNIRRIVLVTDGTHMARSVRCFRAVGFDVVPAACNYRVCWNLLSPGSFLPKAGAVTDLQAASHEWLGIVWYWLHGRV